VADGIIGAAAAAGFFAAAFFGAARLAAVLRFTATLRAGRWREPALRAVAAFLVVFLRAVLRPVLRAVFLRAALARLVVRALRALPLRPVVRFFSVFLIAMVLLQFCSTAGPRLP
jgi:hypothetical protein